MSTGRRQQSVQPKESFRKGGADEVGFDEDGNLLPEPQAAPSSFSLDGTLLMAVFIAGWLWIMADLTGMTCATLREKAWELLATYTTQATEGAAGL